MLLLLTITNVKYFLTIMTSDNTFTLYKTLLKLVIVWCLGSTQELPTAAACHNASATPGQTEVIAANAITRTTVGVASGFLLLKSRPKHSVW